MTRVSKTVLLLGALLATVPLGAQAAVFLQGENFKETTEITESDLFITGDTVAVLHDVRDDVYAAGSRVTIEAAAGGDVMAAGNVVRVTGRAGDDVVVAGGEVRLTGERADDVFAAGALVEIAVNTVDGSVYAGGQQVRLSGTIAGDVWAAGEEIVITSDTTIGGDLIVHGEAAPTIEQGAVIRGTVTHKVVDAMYERGGSTIAGWVRGVVSWFVVSLVLLYLWRPLLSETVAKSLTASGRSLGIGVLWLLLTVPAFVVFLITIVGWPLAILVALLAPVLFIVAHGVAVMSVGVWLSRRVLRAPADSQREVVWAQVLLGAVVLKTIQLVPVIGWLVVVVVTLMALGALLATLWKRFRSAG